jgi:hypothetical protein
MATAQLVTAPGDGVAPAVLLTLGQRLKGQYLFNVPEGFSRLVLEHKVRPNLNLRAVFATEPAALVSRCRRRRRRAALAGLLDWGPSRLALRP